MLGEFPVPSASHLQVVQVLQCCHRHGLRPPLAPPRPRLSVHLNTRFLACIYADAGLSLIHSTSNGREMRGKAVGCNAAGHHAPRCAPCCAPPPAPAPPQPLPLPLPTFPCDIRRLTRVAEAGLKRVAVPSCLLLSISSNKMTVNSHHPRPLVRSLGYTGGGGGRALSPRCAPPRPCQSQ